MHPNLGHTLLWDIVLKNANFLVYFVGMSFGSFTAEQAEILRPYIVNKIVHDFGAGDLVLAKQLIKLGAQKVIAIDKEPKPSKLPGRVEYHRMYFREWKEPVDTLFMSWPQNYYEVAMSLSKLCAKAKTVIYLGKNTDGTVCGTPELFQSFLQRQLLQCVPDKANTLIILGEYGLTPRLPTTEEYAGIMLDRLICSGV